MRIDDNKIIYNWRELKNYKNDNEDTEDGFYHFYKDLMNFPDAWCYIVWSRRGPGKTYSALWNQVYNEFPIIYMKRTVEDVNSICEGKNSANVDMAPYVPITRDKFVDIEPLKISNGLGAFYKTDVDGEKIGNAISYVMALNKIKSVKGFEASNCDWILLDEFIPQIGERINHREGEQLLDLYMTVIRDRVKRGKKELKLVLFANAEEISTPITRELEIIDDMALLNTSGDDNYMYLKDKRIMLHHIVNGEVPSVRMQDDSLGIYHAMKNTSWGRKTFLGEFSNNDFSNVCKMSLKNMVGFCHLKYKAHDYYMYLRNKDGMYYMTDVKIKCQYDYNLYLENDQKRFYEELYYILRDACVGDMFKFKQYSMYDLIINYKKFFNV